MTNHRRSDRARRHGPEVVAIEGLSGAGKTSVVRTLSKVPGIHVVAEAYDRFPRRPSLEFGIPDELLALEERLLAEDVRRYVESHRARTSASTVVTDTDFLGTLTYVHGLATEFEPRWNVLVPLLRRARSELGRGRWGVADLYLYLVVPPMEALARAARAPATHPAVMRERHHRVGRFEQDFFLRHLPRLLPGRVETIPGSGTTEEIAGIIRERLSQASPPATFDESEKVLAWFDRAASAIRAKASEPTQGRLL